MNKSRREQLKTIYAKICDIKSDLEQVCDDEEYAYDRIPENLQGSERAEKMEEAIDGMSNASSSLDDALYELNEIING